MIRRILTFHGPYEARLEQEEYLAPEGRPLIVTDFSTVSPGTELFCIREEKRVRPGYIRVSRLYCVLQFISLH